MTERTKKAAPWGPETLLVRGGTMRSSFEETSESLYLTSGYIYETAENAEAAFKGDTSRYIYSRYGNPTVSMFQDRLALLEGAKHCVATASGMAAMFASLACLLKSGDRIVASRALFGSCYFIISELLPRFGVDVEFVDGTDLNQWAEVLKKPAKAVFVETPSNPTLEIIDLLKITRIAHAAGAYVIVDNVFATPILQRPLEFGVDMVMYSTTKHIDGQGRGLGGAILTNDDTLFEDFLIPFLRHTGPAMSPFNAWVMLKGLETLSLRMERHCHNAHVISKFLTNHKIIKSVLYPGLDSHPQHQLAMSQMKSGSTILTFEINGGKDAAFQFLNSLQLINISNNLGDAKSLITHPATTTHQRLSVAERAHLGITDGMTRLSVGLEDVEDLIEDLNQALQSTPC